jgi:hypothetical protein
MFLESGRQEAWLEFLDTYRTLCIDPTAEFRSLCEILKFETDSGERLANNV